MRSVVYSSLYLVAVGILLGVPVFAAFTGSDFNTVSTVRDHFAPGTDNALIAEFQLPNPVNDTILTNGATDIVSAGDALSTFSGTNKYFDANNDNSYDNGEGVATSSDELLSSTDTILTDISGILTAFPELPEETDAGTAVGWIDSGPTASVYDSSENLGTLIRNASSATNGRQVRIFPSDIGYLADTNGSDYNVTSDNALVEDVDADGYLSSGDTVLIAGHASVHRFDTDDGVCFDASVVADTEYDVGEIIWRDIAGTCASFTTGIDIILSGNSAPSGTSTEFGSENEVGFLDGNTNDAYNCSRGGDCEAIAYAGVNGIDLVTDGTLTTSVGFFDGSSEVTDGVRAVADSWDEASNALETIVFFSEKTDAGEAKYFYLDADGNTDFSATDPVLLSIIEGNALSTGQTWRTFYDNDHYYYDKNGDGQYHANDTGHDALILSEDTVLDAGVLNGGGQDEVLVSETVGGDGNAAWSAFLSSEKFHDHDASGAYADGDDILSDTDSSGYYNADDVLTIKIADETGSIENAHLDGVYIYQRTGSTCAGSGTDTLLGSDVSTPFLSQAITLTKSPYTSSDTTSSKTLCVYADISASAPVAIKWWPMIPSSGIVFASGTVSSAISLRNSTDVYISHSTNASLTASTRAPSTTTSYAVSYLQGATAAPAGAIAYVVFPTGYNVTGASISCTDDGVNISGTEVIFGQIIGVTNIAAQISAGSTVACTVSGVINPETEGVTGAFYIGTTNDQLNPYTIDDDNTVIIEEETIQRGGTVYAPKRMYSIEVKSPNGGELYDAEGVVPITWANTGNNSMPYVNIYASLQEGDPFLLIAEHTANDGHYLWHPLVPSQGSRIKVAATDLLTEVTYDVSDALFTISSGATNDTGENEEADQLPVRKCSQLLPEEIAVGDYLLGMNSDGSTFPAVYYVATDCKRHPFLNEVTYFTYQSDFSVVKTIPIALMERIVEGRTMPVNPGTVLVKTPTSPHVYYVHGETGDLSPLLIKIRTEQEAAQYFGERWNELVIDVPAPLLSLHTMTVLFMHDILSI